MGNNIKLMDMLNKFKTKYTREEGNVKINLLPVITYRWHYWKDSINDQFKFRELFFSWLGIEFSIIINNGKNE